MKIVIASTNPHKIKELQDTCPSTITLTPMSELGFVDDLPETGNSLSHNAYQKAYAIFSKIGGNILAEDTGLFVEALGGRPGVHTARYAGENATYMQNNALLLSELESASNRSAYFQTVFSFIHLGKKWEFSGTLRGHIAIQAAGTAGFGYDPLFIPEGADNTLAELGPDWKKANSHRSFAFKQVLEFITERQKLISLRVPNTLDSSHNLIA